jgi:RNA dependent RNA polymerase
MAPPIAVLPTITTDMTHWAFNLTPSALRPPPKQTNRSPKIKSLTVVKNQGTDPLTCRLDFDYSKESLPTNRVLKEAEADRYVHLSVADLRFPDMKISDAGDFLAEIIWNGIKLNNETYYFFGHSNSQLKSRSCTLIRAHSNAQVEEAIMALGEFEKINTAAKRQYPDY